MTTVLDFLAIASDQTVADAECVCCGEKLRPSAAVLYDGEQVGWACSACWFDEPAVRLDECE